MNDLVDYIKTHPDWRTELTQKPYCLTIKDDGPYTIFTYSQIDSDFYNPIVKVSRGIILKNAGQDDMKIVSWRYNKFANWGEGYADKIDWATARVQEKVDGSLIALWFDEGQWHISTNGMISAFTCDLQNPTEDFKCFGDLVLVAIGKYAAEDMEKGILY